jgi:hypothetical protein
MLMPRDSAASARVSANLGRRGVSFIRTADPSASPARGAAQLLGVLGQIFIFTALLFAPPARAIVYSKA